jgi:HEAT repeat protein
MEPFSTASVLAIAGKLVTTEVTKIAIAGIKRQLQPDEMAVVLQKAIASAQSIQPETGGIFFRCQSKAAKEFLEQFFKSSAVVKELQKPLQDDGKPDIDVLIVAFDRSAKQHSEMQKYIPDTLRSWMETFVESYFEQLQGICFQVAKAQYLKQLARRVDDVKFVGIAVPGEEVEKQEVLAQIFVMPDVREERSKLSSILPQNYPSYWDSEPQTAHKTMLRQQAQSEKSNKLVEEQKEWAMRDRSAPRIPAQTVINNQKKAVILGAPGSGKTMLASYFALMLCQSNPSQIGLPAEDDWLPIVVRIRDWILQPKMGLLEYLRSNAEANLACKELPTGFFEHWLERGRALILLDGLDEVVDEAQRRKVAEQIETFLHQYQDNPAVITSRPAGYRWDFFNLDEFPHYTLESFDDKQVAAFIDHWYDSRLKEDPAQADRRKADLQKAFARNERIRLLAKNPLLLTIITLIHRYQAELPRQRCKLYEKAVETLLTSWDSGKEIKLYSQVLLFLKSDDLLYILKKLAYWIHAQGSTGEIEGGTLIDKDELIRWLRKEIQPLKKCEAHEAKGEAERFIDFIQRRTGLLNEQGRDRYAFVHKTFQEYLTAEEIFDRADVEDDTEIILAHFRQHLHDQHWREVLLLLVSKLKGKKAQKAIQAVLDAGSEYEQWLHRDLLFAGWCLTEDPPELTVVAADWVGEILDRLVCLEVGNSKQISSKIRNEARKILHCFGETSVEQEVWAKLQAQGDQINRFRRLKYQASLGQEAEVISQLLALLDNEHSTVRASAAGSFSQLGNTSPEVVNGLLVLLDDEHSTVRASAAEALGRLGNTSQKVVNSLLALLDDEHSTVRASAAEAFSRLGNTSQKVVNGLLTLLGHKSKSPFENIRVAESLIQLGNTSTKLVDYLLSLGGSVLSVRAAALLIQLKVASPSVMNHLLSLIGDDGEEPSSRLYATELLVILGHINPEVVNSLLPLLKNQDQSVKILTATALIQLGDISSEVIDAFLLLFGNEHSSVVYDSAATALANLGNATPKVLENLHRLLNKQHSFMSEYATEILVQMADPSPSVINKLLSLMDSEESYIGQRAREALVRLSKTSDKIAPLLAQWLEQNKDKYVAAKIDCLWSIVVE